MTTAGSRVEHGGDEPRDDAPSGDAPGGDVRRARGTAVGLVRTMRPQQWVKNVLVVAAPLASGRLLEPAVLASTLVALAAFCLASSSVYLLNDALDVDADRAHATKRHRPVASGAVPVATALAASAVLGAAALALTSLASSELAALVAFYLAVQVAYCVRLKHEPVLDIAIVASGFLLRAIGGGVAGGIELSQWFLLVTAFGSLFMVSGKRYSEKQLASAVDGATRASLLRYTDTYLRFVWSLSAAVMITTYGLWAFEIESTGDSVLSTLSIVPFVLAVLRYAVDIDGGTAGAPEGIALHDRVLQVLALTWVLCFAAGVYL